MGRDVAQGGRPVVGVGMILCVDNFDSFVYNLARYLQLLGKQTRVVRNDQVSPRDLDDPQVEMLLISPGPCGPEESGQSLALIRAALGKVPILGVCLGHQAIVAALGGKIVRSSAPMHGQASPVYHDGRGEFVGLPTPFAAARYHSLIADAETLPTCLEVSARTDCGTIMAVRHRDWPVFGWQFHPESILTEVGMDLLRGCFRAAGLAIDTETKLTAEHDVAAAREDIWPSRPVTF